MIKLRLKKDVYDEILCPDEVKLYFEKMKSQIVDVKNQINEKREFLFLKKKVARKKRLRVAR